MFIYEILLFWLEFIVLLVVICELYVVCILNLRDVEFLEDGYYVCWFIKIEICKLLLDWMFINGGLVSKLNLYIEYFEDINKFFKY